MIPVGLIGTSGWAEGMFLSALKDHPQGKIVAICGRNQAHTQEVADRWNIPHVFTDYNALIDSGLVQAVIVSTPNNSHFPIAIKALEAGLHIICEKPLGLNYAEAERMAEVATKQNIINLVPYTWSFMPTARYIKELIDTGYIGKPYHLNLRWYANFGLGSAYQWRYDKAVAGSGVIGDLGSHFLHLAYWFFGKISHINCQLGFMGQRPVLDPEGKPYEVADDTALATFTYENGAQGVIHLSAMALQSPAPLTTTHEMEFHGSEGTLRFYTDFDQLQRVSGVRTGEDGLHELPVPDHFWGGARRDSVFATMGDVFSQQDVMTRQFISGIVSNTHIKPDFNDGAYIQRIVDAAVKSHAEQRTVRIDEIR